MALAVPVALGLGVVTATPAFAGTTLSTTAASLMCNVYQTAEFRGVRNCGSRTQRLTANRCTRSPRSSTSRPSGRPTARVPGGLSRSVKTSTSTATRSLQGLPPGEPWRRQLLRVADSEELTAAASGAAASLEHRARPQVRRQHRLLPPARWSCPVPPAPVPPRRGAIRVGDHPPVHRRDDPGVLRGRRVVVAVLEPDRGVACRYARPGASAIPGCLMKHGSSARDCVARVFAPQLARTNVASRHTSSPSSLPSPTSIRGRCCDKTWGSVVEHTRAAVGELAEAVATGR